MWKVIRVFGMCAVLLTTAAVREARSEQHGPLFPDFCEVESDFRWFEPVYCDCPDGPMNNEGIFYSYERVNWNILAAPRYPVGEPGLQVVSSVLIDNDPIVFPGVPGAPPPTPVPNAVDVSQPDSNFGWGNRHEFGYIWDNVGWNASVLYGLISSDQENYGQENLDPLAQPFTGTVAVLFTIPAGLLDGFVDADGDGTIDDVDSDGNPPVGSPSDFGDLVTFVPSFDTLTIENQTRVDGVELMRTIRRDNFFARDSTFEFLYGVRFMRIDSQLQAFGVGSILADSNWLSKVENKMVGPQVAFKWGRRKGRWSLRSQGRFMAAMNIRDASLEGTMGSLLQVTFPPNNPLYFNPTSFAQYDSDLQFSPVAEARLDAVFELTKKVNLTVGYTGTYASNVGYGSNMVAYTLPALTLRSLDDLDTQHFFSNGWNIGIEINR